MVNSKKQKTIKKDLPAVDGRYKRLVSMGQTSQGIINDLSAPIDATNRFINLALHSVGEGSQGRQFLLDSKEGIRETLALLNKLNTYAKKMEKEIRKIAEDT